MPQQTAQTIGYYAAALPMREQRIQWWRDAKFGDGRGFSTISSAEDGDLLVGVRHISEV